MKRKIKIKRNIRALLLFIVIFSAGFCFGRVSTPSVNSFFPSADSVKQQILAEIDQKFTEKAGNLLLPIGNVSQQRTTLGGTVVGIDYGKKIMEVKVPNRYTGGSITEYLYEPNYYIKRIKVLDSTILVKSIFNISKGFPEITEISISFEDIKKGQTVYVESTEPFTLSEDKQIIAKSIRIS